MIPSRSVRSCRSIAMAFSWIGAPVAGGNPLLHPRQRVGEPRAADHEVADVAHQLVEAGEVDADEV